VLLVPEQTVVEPAIEPPTETGFTVTVASVELVEEQLPLCITALYFVVTVRFVAVYVEVVLAISTGVTQLSVEYCHFRMDPV
jgi:hypothetical protein